MWRLISAVPYNRELVLGTVDNDTAFVREFPCLLTSAEAGINGDLGTRIDIQPIE